VVSGVPNGERKDNVLYTCDQLDEKYTTFNISQVMMSWWTPEIEYKRRKEYSAIQEDSEDYKHFVLGQHGVPTFSVFDRVRFKKEDYEVFRYVLTQTMFDRTKHTDFKTDEVRYHLEDLVILPPIPSEYGIPSKVGIGYDVGYSPDPGVFFVLYQDYRTGLWKNLVRLILQRVEYALQRETLLLLDRIYNFDFIGMDMGGPGKVQYQDLTGENSDKKFKEREFSERIFPVEFGGTMVVAIKNNKNEVIEKKDLIKRVAVETTSRWVQESHRFVFALQDDNLMEELERTKFTRNAAGEPIYKTSDDHQFAAMMCAIMAYEHKFGVPLSNPKPELQIKLRGAKWFDPTGVLA